MVGCWLPALGTSALTTVGLSVVVLVIGASLALVANRRGLAWVVVLVIALVVGAVSIAAHAAACRSHAGATTTIGPARTGGVSVGLAVAGPAEEEAT